jgi:cytochrome c-type biogenesis protein CcmH
MLSVFLVGCIPLTVFAGLEVRSFADPQQEQRYYKLVDELRCLVCQNQNLADSNSQLAQDLRNKVYAMVTTGKTDQEVIDYMVNRYGEYVLYRPPFNPVTAVLWLGPFLIVLVAIIWLLVYIARRNRSKPAGLCDEDRKRSQRMLDDDDKDDKS